MDELWEMLTLAQTRKLDRRIFILLYGSTYWNELSNFDALVRYGMISPDHLKLFRFADDPESALRLLKDGISEKLEEPSPAFAKSANRRPKIPVH